MTVFSAFLSDFNLIVFLFNASEILGLHFLCGVAIEFQIKVALVNFELAK